MLGHLPPTIHIKYKYCMKCFDKHLQISQIIDEQFVILSTIFFSEQQYFVFWDKILLLLCGASGSCPAYDPLSVTSPRI